MYWELLLIDLKTGLMPDWQQNIKRLLDVVSALIGINHSFAVNAIS